MRKIVLVLILIIGGAFLADIIYKNMKVSDIKSYEKDYEKFVKLNYEVTDFYSLDSDFYAVMIYNYNDTKIYKFPTNKKEYLVDKLRYYEEVSFKHKPKEISQMKAYVQNELKNTKDTDTIPSSELFEKNRKLYLQNEGKLFPYYKKMRIFFNYTFIRDKSIAVTNEHYSKLKDAVEDLRQIKKIKDSSPKTPSIFWILDGGGSGKKIPLDDYENRIELN